MLKTYKHPPGPGVYAEHVTPEGFIRIYPVTEAQVAKRHAVAEAGTSAAGEGSQGQPEAAGEVLGAAPTAAPSAAEGTDG